MSNNDSGGIRDFLNSNPIPVAAGLIVLIGLVFYFFVGNPFSNRVPKAPMYFSNDDGATFYIDDMDNIPPFDGGDGLGAFVVRAPGGEPYVKYLYKYDESLHDAIREADAENRRRTYKGLFYKAPGDTEWLSDQNPEHEAAIAELKSTKTADGQSLSVMYP